MRIIIELEGLEGRGTTSAGISGEGGRVEAAARQTAPPGVLTTAATIGARDGGAAPTIPPTLGPTPTKGERAPAAFIGQSAAGIREMSAGAAPGAAAGIPVKKLAE